MIMKHSAKFGGFTVSAYQRENYNVCDKSFTHLTCESKKFMEYNFVSFQGQMLGKSYTQYNSYSKTHTQGFKTTFCAVE
jgi:hypothetical protein